MRDVVTKQLEAFVIQQVLNVATRAGEEVIDAEYLASGVEQLVCEMRP
jgi:hypothetical protein